MPLPPPSPSGPQSVGPALSLGLNMAAGVALFTFLGAWAGGKTGHKTIGILSGLFLGMVYAGYEVWKVVRDLQKQNDAPPSNHDRGTSTHEPPAKD